MSLKTKKRTSRLHPRHKSPLKRRTSSSWRTPNKFLKTFKTSKVSKQTSAREKNTTTKAKKMSTMMRRKKKCNKIAQISICIQNNNKTTLMFKEVGGL